MAHNFVNRFVRGVAANSSATVLLDASVQGIFRAEAWSFGPAPGIPAVPVVPGVPTAIQPVSPPGAVYIEGELSAAVPAGGRLRVVLDDGTGNRLSSNPVSLQGAAGDTFMITVFISDN